MYGRFRVLSGDISLMYGSPKGEKPEKCTPEVGFSHDGLPYISEKAHDKAPILPYKADIGMKKGPRSAVRTGTLKETGYNQPVFCRPAATPDTVHRIR